MFAYLLASVAKQFNGMRWRYDDVISFDQILRFAYGQRTLNFTAWS